MNAIGISNKNLCRIEGSFSTAKGSTLIIVLIILSILSLVAATLSFTSRLETISSANFAEGLQARMAATTGIQAASALLPSTIPYTAFTQPWALRNPSSRDSFHGLTAPLADFFIEDESAKLNINAADETFIADALSSILKSSGIDAAPARKLAREIYLYRLGPDQKPGDSRINDDLGNAFAPVAKSVPHINDRVNGGRAKVNERDKFNPDPSQTPYGDDLPFLSVNELKLLSSMTPEIFEAIRPFVTAYSASEPVCSIDGFSVEMVDINTASAQDIFEILQRRFPEKDVSLLKQFAVNVVDARDPDSIPTQLPGIYNDLPFLGVEKTPYINEVWPDSITQDDEGDDGQYIELFNPYDEPLSVDGWKVEVAGTTVMLDGIMNPGGFLVITDDYDNSNDPDSREDRKGEGSFYDIFNLVRGGNSKRIIEKRQLEIPNESAVIYLKDRDGNLIDYFAYKNGTFAGVKRSFQRVDPRVRYATWEFCSPLKKNFSYIKTEADGTQIAPFAPRDRPFDSTLDLMDVFAGYAHSIISDKTQNPRQTNVTWALPSLNSERPSDLDLRMIDLFRSHSRPSLSPSEIVKLLGRVDEVDLYRLVKKQNAPEFSFGLVNINTAPSEILQALPGFDKNLANQMDKYRKNIEKEALYGDNPQTPTVPFKGYYDLADFLMRTSPDVSGFQGKSRDEILSALRVILPLITVNSRSFSVYSENRRRFPVRNPDGTSNEIRHQTRSIVKSLIHVDARDALRVIDWAYLTE